VSALVRDLGLEKGSSLDEAGERVLKGYSEPTPIFELLRICHSEGAVQTTAMDPSN
jgi:hypothetical protein